MCNRVFLDKECSICGINSSMAKCLNRKIWQSENGLRSHLFWGIMVLLFSGELTQASNSCQVTYDKLPLVTHYSQALDQVVFGSRDKKIVDSTNFATDLKNYQAKSTDYVQLFNSQILPNKYLANNYDLDNFSSDEIVSSLKNLCDITGVNVNLVQATEEIKGTIELKKLIKYHLNSWQIIHSLPYKNNLFSIVLPPDLKEGDSLPFVIHGGYGLNNNFINEEGVRLRTLLGQAYNQGVKAVGILWNGMGAVGSRTINDQAYLEFNEFFSILKAQAKIDDQKGIAFGTSRGGITALNLASHKFTDSMRIAYVDSSVPAADARFCVDLVSPTFPRAMEANDWTTGYVGSWMSSFRYPLSDEPRLTGLSGLDAHYAILTNDFKSGDSNRYALFSEDRINKLNRNGTAVFLEIGSHDLWVAFADQIALGYRFYSLLNKVEIKINYLAGHFVDLDQRSKRLLNALLQLASSAKSDRMINNHQVSRNIVSGIGGDQTTILYQPTLTYSALPITVEVPKFIIRESPVQIVLTGITGRKFSLNFVGSEGDRKTIFAQIGDYGSAILSSSFDQWPNSRYQLESVFELNPLNQPEYRLRFQSTVLNEDNLMIYKYDGDLRMYAHQAADIIIRSIFGDNCEHCSFKNKASPGSFWSSTGYGLVEVARDELH